MRGRTPMLWLLLVAASTALPTALDAQVWEVSNRKLELIPRQAFAHFGSALAIGDFNGDGIDDLVVSAPDFDTALLDDVGSCTVYWGSSDRTLVEATSTTFGAGADYLAGYALAAGDFDGDGRDEVAVGMPGENNAAGLVYIWEYESGTWLGTQVISQEDTPPTAPEPYDSFGEVLAVGDFNHDSYDDLAVGVFREDWGADQDAGIVQVFYRALDTGLRTDNAITIVSPGESSGEFFGFALATGDFDDDDDDDLAVGAPSRVVSGYSSAGVVEIYDGSPAGLALAPSQVIDDADTSGGALANGQYFGNALAAGDFNQSALLCLYFGSHCYTDLAIGVVGEWNASGKVVVVPGSSTGLAPAGSSTIDQASVGETDEANDYFGAELAAGRLNRDFFGPEDLAIGVPLENFGATDDGIAHLVFGSVFGINAGQASQFVEQKTGFAIAPPATFDEFAWALAIGDLDGDGWGDLVVGVPNKGANDSGAVQVLYGALFADGFESTGTSNWVP